MTHIDAESVERLKVRYRRANRTERSAIPDEFVKTTGRHHKYAIGVLGGKRGRKHGPVRMLSQALLWDIDEL